MWITKQEFPDPPGTLEEEKSLHRRALEGDKQALDDLVLPHSRIVLRTAFRWSGPAQLEDLYQAGMKGLSEAVPKWDPERGYRFLTYAWHRALLYMRRELEGWSVIRVPYGRVRMRNKLRKLMDEGCLLREAADKMDLTENHAESLLSIQDITTVTGDGDGLPVQLEPADPTSLPDPDIQDIRELCRESLSEKQWDILSRYYGIGTPAPVPAETLAEEHGCGPRKIWYIIQQARQTMNNVLEEI